MSASAAGRKCSHDVRGIQHHHRVPGIQSFSGGLLREPYTYVLPSVDVGNIGDLASTAYRPLQTSQIKTCLKIGAKL